MHRADLDGSLAGGGANSGKVVNGRAVVQAHVADPKVKTAMVRKPAPDVCENCHNPKSPHFRGFSYDGMVTFSHPVRPAVK